MRYLSLILLCILPLQVQGQGQYLHFQPGDHIYYMESLGHHPIHYQVEVQVEAHVLEKLTQYGAPKCYLAYDPITRQVIPDGLLITEQDSCTVIHTPFLSPATSFKVCTRNRVFVFVTNPTNQKKL